MNELLPEAIDPAVNSVFFRRKTRGLVWCWGPRRIADCELVLPVSGEFEFRASAGNEVCRLKRGDLLLIRPEEEHVFRRLSNGDGDGFIFIHFELLKSEPFAAHGYTPQWPRRMTHFPADHVIFDLFRDAARLFRSPERGSEALLESVVKLIWLYLFAPVRSFAHPKLAPMLEYIHEHLLEHPTRFELAAAFKLSPQRVNAIFKRELGFSPGDYVRRELAGLAAALLRYDQLSVKETAEKLGYANAFYFSRMFKKACGFPPAEFRRDHAAPDGAGAGLHAGPAPGRGENQ
ncbi:MAG: AraC family transcriptional regulator [Victivallaceae bacterium]